MALNLWFAPDVARILLALASSGRDRGPEYAAALRDVALAFGLIVPGDSGLAELRAGHQVTFTPLSLGGKAAPDGRRACNAGCYDMRRGGNDSRARGREEGTW